MRLSKAVVFAVTLLSSFSVWAAQRTFVSGSGNDANPCTHDLPCRSFAAAMAVTNASGEIVAVDSAGYGTVTITKAVAIVAPLGVHAGVSAFSGNAIEVTAGASDVVVLRNLYVNSQGADNGIFLTSAAALHIEHCVVSGFSFDNIDLEPVTDAAVAISDTQVRDTGGFGFYADSAQALTISIDHCRIEHNLDGVVADRATVMIRDTLVAQNAARGLQARGNGGATIMAIQDSAVSNSGTGLEVDNGTVTIYNTTALGNGTAFYVFATSGVAKVSIESCTVSAGIYGVIASGIADVNVANSTIGDNTAAGIHVESGAAAHLTRNTITRNGIGIDNNASTVESTADNMVVGNASNSSGTITSATKM